MGQSFIDRYLMVACACMLLLGGCAMHYHDTTDRVKWDDIPKLTVVDRIWQRDADTIRLRLPAASVACSEGVWSAPYDRLLWLVAKLPFVKTDDGDHLLPDTGIGYPARTSATVISRRRWPTMRQADLAFVESVSVGKGAFLDFGTTIENGVWQFRVCGIVVYELDGIALGIPVLKTCRYIAFDNPNHQVRFSVTESFSPPVDSVWQNYPMRERLAVPWVTIPINGVSIELVADSGGGPRIILNPEQWKALAPNVRVVSHKESSYPTWGGPQPIDEYTVKNLTIGDKSIGRAKIWVRQPNGRDFAPTIGLGPLADETVVFDFERMRLWVGGKTHGERD